MKILASKNSEKILAKQEYIGIPTQKSEENQLN